MIGGDSRTTSTAAALLLVAAASLALEEGARPQEGVRRSERRGPRLGDQDPPRGAPASRYSTLESYRRAESLVRRALNSLGEPDTLAAAGGITLAGRGTLDLTTMMQGTRPDRPEWVAIEEQLAVDLVNGRVAFETRGRVNADAEEWLRFVFDDLGRMLVVLRRDEEAFWVPAQKDQSRRYLRHSPHLLLREALEHRRALRHLGRVGTSEAVALTLASGTPLTLLFDSETGLLDGFEYLLDLPLLGDTSIRWELDEYRQVEGLGIYPAGYRVYCGDRLFKEMTYDVIQAGIDEAAVLREPEGIAFPEPPALESPRAAEPTASSPVAEVRTLADGVYLAMNVRGGFHPLFVELEDSVLVVDAPAGYHELQMVPAVDWAGDVTSSSVGRRLLDTIRATVPGKPVRYVVLTHHHGDHAGGIRPLLAAGATVITSAVTKPVIERAARASFSLEPDELSGREAVPRIELVEGQRTISDGERTVRILEVGSNPHAEGMLVVYLPESRILYQSDLFMPSEGGFPDLARVPVMKWFVGWLEESGLSPERIYAIHGSAEVTEEQLGVIRSLRQ